MDYFDAALHHISGSAETKYANEAERLSGRLRYDLDYATIGEIFKFGLHEYLEQIQDRLAEIDHAIHATYCAEASGCRDGKDSARDWTFRHRPLHRAQRCGILYLRRQP